MITEAISVPFRMPNLYHGLAEGKGLLKLEPGSVVLDFEVKDSLFNTVKLDSNEVRIPLAEISSCALKKGWFTTWIILDAGSLRALRNVPGADGAELRLKIDRKNRNNADEIVTSIMLAIHSQDVQRMLAGIDEGAK